MISAADLTRTMETYGRAWQTHDAGLVITLFTEDATYQENPFGAPFNGHEAIGRYWREATSPHRDVAFTWTDLGAAGEMRMVE